MFLRKPLVCTISLQPRLCSAFLVSSFCAFPITNRGTCVFIQSLRGKQSTESWVIYTRSSRRNGSIVSFEAVYRDVTLPPKRDEPSVARHTERRLGMWAYRADGFWNSWREVMWLIFQFFSCIFLPLGGSRFRDEKMDIRKEKSWTYIHVKFARGWNVIQVSLQIGSYGKCS